MSDEYDAFPNAPGLSKRLGLTKPDEVPVRERGRGLHKERWYSICSAHREIRVDCPRCRVGSYHKVWRSALGRLVYKVCPPLWRWWANRGVK